MTRSVDICGIQVALTRTGTIPMWAEIERLRSRDALHLLDMDRWDRIDALSRGVRFLVFSRDTRGVEPWSQA